MSVYRNLGKKTAVEENMNHEIDGQFLCQACGETVDQAKFFAHADLLLWTCSKGHVSKIEDFKI
jgi:hypothetical protein